ncbi:MAG TPA: hypothetical protein VI521_00915 [Candidatus Babeliales bacterium]|nr:hypothetical protein [Candidatus Babeliales bacterium]
MRKSLFLLLFSSFPLSSLCADPSQSQDPFFLSPEQVLEQAEPLPEEFEAVKEWIESEKNTFQALNLPHMHSHSDWVNNQEAVSRLLASRQLRSLSDGNYIFAIPEQPAVVRFSGLNNTLRSKASNIGIDSGLIQNLCDIVEGRAVGYKSDVLNNATLNTTPVHQHSSMLAYYLAMRKGLTGKKIQPVQTWVAQYGSGEELCDANYVIVQPRLTDDTYQLLSSLDAVDRASIIDKAMLPTLADAVESGAWNITADNLWINTKTGILYITDLEGPNNEGWGDTPGTNPRWGRAIFSYAGDGASCHQWKWNHNVRCGYDSVHAMLPDDLQNEWDQIKEARAPKD